MPYGPNDNKVLQAQIRTQIEAGTLPRPANGKVFAGYGNGEQCCVCRDRVWPQQILYEVDTGDAHLHFHMSCHAAWLLLG